MACGSCGTGEDGKPRGCKSNGACTSGGCEKLSVFDWLSNMTLPGNETPFNIYEVRFKNGRKHFFKNTEKLSISMGDVVAVESSPGHDIGVVSLGGELVKVQMKKRKISIDSEEIKKIYRKASQRDIEIWEKARNRELETQKRGREGVGSCGRELCCSTWLTDFRKVTTSAARYQQLSLNPLKLAGQCGKLKCCLNFELDTYLDALNDFPKQEKILKTESGDAEFVKMDIFKKLIWYTYKENRSKWYKLSLEQVQEIIDLNNKNEVSIPLEDYESEIEEVVAVDFENVVGQDSLTRFDTPKKNRRRNRNKKRKKVSSGVVSYQSQNNQKGHKSKKSNKSNHQKRNNNSQANTQNTRRRKPKPNANTNQ